MLHYAVASPLRVQGYRCWDGSERSLDSPENNVAEGAADRATSSETLNFFALFTVLLSYKLA
jgi:hypothetical protein